MWGWLVDYAVWLVLGASVVLVLLLLFNGAIRQFLSRANDKEPHEILHRIVNPAFWTVELLIAAILITAIVAMSSDPASGAPALTAADVETWFVDKGLSNVIILIAGIVLWIILKNMIPPMITRLMRRPQRGESREGMKRRADTLTSVFLGLSKILIILMVVLVILSGYVEIGPLLAGLGVVGIAVGFGAQYLIRDLIAGVFILMENQYRVGDVAKVGGVSGMVEEINLRKTVLRDLDGIVHHIPNGEIQVASNYSRHFSRVNLDISVSYGTDLDYAISVINDVCNRMAEDDAWKDVLRTTPQVLRVNKLGDSGIDIKIIGEVKPLEQWRVMGELRLRIKKEFDNLGIEIPWPHTKIFFGNKPGD